MQTETNNTASDTATKAKARKLCVKLAATADPLRNANVNERETAMQKLIALCERHGFAVADFIAAHNTAQPESEAKPEQPKAAKPEQPSKPSASDAKRAADFDARIALIRELRAAVSRIYNGPSLAIRTNPKRFAVSAYAELLASPKHRTSLAKLSVRDESALAEILTRGTASGAFNPSELNLDCGIFSRLASVGFIAANNSDKAPFKLSAAALSHARKAANRAA